MPRKARMDSPGTLHHIMGRGIEGTKIFRNRYDRADFVERLSQLSVKQDLIVYAWSLLSNHYHILARTGRHPLAKSMRVLLTGYVVNFNKRHKRRGHLFQNRYKSIVCEDDPYLLELTRYIHLNPLRAGLVADLSELSQYPWAGHSAILGKTIREWQDSESILAYFGTERVNALQNYEEFVADGVTQGHRPELGGGGLLRSNGGWSSVVSERGRGESFSFDARLLGGSDFVDQVLSEVDKKERVTLRLLNDKKSLSEILSIICASEGVDEGLVLSGRRLDGAVQCRKLFAQVAVGRLRYSGAEVARFLGVSTSAITKMVNVQELPDVDVCLKLL